MGDRLLIPVSPDTWASLSLDEEATGPSIPVSGGKVFLIKSHQRPGAGWLLMVPPGSSAKVNGRAPLFGVHVLQDKDEIWFMNGDVGCRVFFSTENPAHVEPFPSMDHAFFCPRCKQKITEGSPSVKCPRCDIWHHQSDDLPCWTYGHHCGVCDQPTDLDSGDLWTPEMC